MVFLMQYLHFFPYSTLFRSGESMPKGQWNERGTKQGVYMIGPNAEYLEGKFAASADPEDIKARMRRALDRSEEHTSELQSPCNLVCRLLLEQKKQKK